ncbi:MAG: DUF4355 domain-containing protein [Candidatus Limiplasma sp.]|nr:DUF4355 domain-containing protein [Candidatus Limiplasma sp.]
MEDIITGLLPLNLQFFAEGEGEPTPPPEGDPKGGNEPPADPKPANLNALLAGDKALQSQYDKLVSKALDTAKGKWEAERNLTAEQLAEQKAKEKEAALAEREVELTRRELRAAALEQMSTKGMPPELIDAISLADEESMAKSLEQAEKAFRAAVDKAVKDKLKGGAPKDTPPDNQATHLAAIRAAAGLKPPKT